ncbi:MAG TPA: DUF6259 domain-containing protein [Phycisphaerae bacterium]|nr:DUF6259 domain-containing protein [Phycisphaerae bacterium]
MMSLLPLVLAVVLNAAPTSQAVVRVEGTKLTVSTPTVQAVFEGPILRSLRPADSEVEFARPGANAVGLDLLYLNTELLGADKLQTVRVVRISDVAARIEVGGADSARTLFVAVDPDTGDIRVTADGLSNRRGLRAVRWTMPVHGDVTTILPIINGAWFRTNQPEPHSRRYAWPFEWNAQLAILKRADRCVMVHCEDQACQFKAIHVTRHPDHTDLGFETEPPGPLWENRTAGGIEWRINAYRGDWKVPAARYKQWMERTYRLADLARHRPAWVKNITLAVCWAAPNMEMLDALAKVHPPEQTLIHLADWRTDKYDVNYPDYVPTDKALEYMAKARQMGFHVAPHFNCFSVYYRHPFYQTVRDYQIRTVDRNIPDGWHWPPQTHEHTRMGYIHPGLGTWRSKLMDVVIEACGKMGTDTAFIDQTFCTWNADNGLVQGMNTVLGMRQLKADLLAAKPGLVLVGEGLTEISFQQQCFAQGHIYDGWGKLEQRHLDLQHGICQFLWGDHTRLIGYHHLRPGEEGYEKGITLYERMGALPTIVTNNPRDLQEMSDLTRRIFDRAKGRPPASRAE